MSPTRWIRTLIKTCIVYNAVSVGESHCMDTLSIPPMYRRLSKNDNYIYTMEVLAAMQIREVYSEFQYGHVLTGTASFQKMHWTTFTPCSNVENQSYHASMAQITGTIIHAYNSHNVHTHTVPSPCGWAHWKRSLSLSPICINFVNSECYGVIKRSFY